ncbi:hypothetical protein QQS21_009283 [Conoideocrella luteorostrata]|uniref:DUF7730 domain-containing protein n=1 Tax=Conoideocrella luteorostrata TaxID=1105319 RepID=A0AAJ0CJY7_9HYPO|nr:hypothetical protein QQS21_009283 [Conoideocrella luteorostrata]
MCYQHVASLIAESSVIHIADIATLGFLLDAMDPPSNASSSLCPNRLFSNAFSSIKSLDLSFRLPRQVYTAIEAQSTQPNSTCTPNQKPSPATTWISMWTDLAHLKHLQALKITLDHDSESSWSAINEQAILRSIHPLTTSPNPELHVTVHMPQVPKTHADPPAHNLPSSFSISRFTRQRFFTERRQDDSVGIVYEEDAYKSFQIPGENVTETVRAAELTMHIWFLGIDLDYLAVEEPSDGESEPELLAS